MVAFVASLLVLVVALAPLPAVAKRYPRGRRVTWGEALVAATYLFFLMWWAYGVVPHLWLTFADSDLGWRVDKIVLGPGGVVDKWLPFTVTYQVLRDIVVVVLHVVFLAAQIAGWAWWQGRGEEKVVVPKSDYGRPLLKEA
ncbi:MAG: hypothetical protein KatS3mg008_1181 [Acidimicrobiales bacterium]|nr:MAG: hypothetical protein KatS3mg008_1181 [Acidimicrobiales bacterium]